MVRVPVRFASVCDLPRKASVRRKAAPTLAMAVVSLVAQAAPASAQLASCGRCNTITIGPFSFPNPFASSAPAPAYRSPERHGSSWSSSGSSPNEPRRKVASLGHSTGHASSSPDKPGGQEAGYSIFVCVRTCDGSFFPLPYSGASGASLEQVCQALCPNAEMALFSMPFGGTISEGVSPTGVRYSAQPNALKFQQSYEETCSCRRPGQSWADALAAAEAKFGHRAHEVVVTEEASVQMSRPKLDPNAKQTAQKAATTRTDATAQDPAAPADSQALATAQFADPDLDANGVDTKLRAATAAVSRETSGIRDDAGDSGFALRPEGRTDRPGGRPRRRAAKGPRARPAVLKTAIRRAPLPASSRASRKAPAAAPLTARCSGPRGRRGSAGARRNIAPAARALPRSVKCTMSR